MAKSAYAAVLFALAATVAQAQVGPRPLDATPSLPLLQVHHENDDGRPAQMLASVPAEAWTITDWYKQNVYDPGDAKIGEVNDVLVDHDGKINAIIVGVGGFLGLGQKDVAVPYEAVHFKTKDNKWFAHINATKDALMAAPGFKFDRNTRKWMPDTSHTTGGPAIDR
jgi:sporulation protein YlmC with PRC-barrel domain